MVAFTAGWVLLIEETFELARVLVALCVSVAFFAIHVAIKPFKRSVAKQDRTHDCPTTEFAETNACLALQRRG